MRSINEIIVHCSATREGQHIPVETIKKWHVEGRGWSDIGYHFYVELDGTIKIQTHPCLLYTSPSPRDRTRSRMPSSA